MKSGEVTLMVLVDFSKAFDTISYETLITKMHQMGFSQSFLNWTLSYVGGRSQFVHIDSKSSAIDDMIYGVPQGSILGPILFNLYVNDLDEIFTSKSIQYADDTTIYEHCKPCSIPEKENALNESLNKLATWTTSNSLATNSLKTKYMVCIIPNPSTYLARIHKLDTHKPNHKNGYQISRTNIPKQTSWL